MGKYCNISYYIYFYMFNMTWDKMFEISALGYNLFEIIRNNIFAINYTVNKIV